MRSVTAINPDREVPHGKSDRPLNSPFHSDGVDCSSTAPLAELRWGVLLQKSRLQMWQVLGGTPFADSGRCYPDGITIVHLGPLGLGQTEKRQQVRHLLRGQPGFEILGHQRQAAGAERFDLIARHRLFHRARSAKGDARG